MKKYYIVLASLIISFFLLNTTFAQQNENNSQNSCILINNNLKYGSSDTGTGDISSLQTFLRNSGHLNSESTGYFGNMTFSAVKAFQKKNGIDSTGYVGPITLAAIKNITCNTTNTVLTENTPTANTQSINSSTSTNQPNQYYKKPYTAPSYSSYNYIDTLNTLPIDLCNLIPVGVIRANLKNNPEIVQVNNSAITDKSMQCMYFYSNSGRAVTSAVYVVLDKNATTPWQMYSNSSESLENTVAGPGYELIFHEASRQYILDFYKKGLSGRMLINTNGTKEEARTAAINIAKDFVPKLPVLIPTVTISASPTSIISGDSSNISWTSTNALVCMVYTRDIPVSFGVDGWKNGALGSATVLWKNSLTGSGIPSGQITSNRLYSINCQGNGGAGSATSSVLITIKNSSTATTSSPTVTLTATPSTVTSGQSAKITMTSTNASSCTITKDGQYWGSGTSVTNVSTGELKYTTVFSATCKNSVGQVVSSATVTVPSVIATILPVTTINATPTSVVSGQTSNISWTSTNATACTVTKNGTVWKNTLQGSYVKTDALTQGTTFFVSCLNGTTLGIPSSVYVGVTPPTVVPLILNEKTTCIFKSNTSQTCTAYSAEYKQDFACSGTESCVVDVRGTKGTQLTWKSTCGGYSYTTIDGQNEMLSFSDCNLIPSPTVTLTATPSTVTSGQSAKITMTSTNASSCTITKDGQYWGSGTSVTNVSTGELKYTTVFSATCKNSVGQVVSNVTVTTTPPVVSEKNSPQLQQHSLLSSVIDSIKAMFDF